MSAIDKDNWQEYGTEAENEPFIIRASFTIHDTVDNERFVSIKKRHTLRDVLPALAKEVAARKIGPEALVTRWVRTKLPNHENGPSTRYTLLIQELQAAKDEG